MFLRIQLPGTVRPRRNCRRQRVILVMGEAPIEPGLVAAAPGVRREPDCLIAPRGQVFSQGGIRSVEGVVPLGIESVRPLAGEEAAMRGIRPGGWHQRQGVTDPLPGPIHQVGGGIATIAIETQVGGADGVPDDQHDVACAPVVRGKADAARYFRTAWRPDERAARTISRPSKPARRTAHAAGAGCRSRPPC